MEARQAVRHVLVLVVAVSERALTLGTLETTKVPVVAIRFSDLTCQWLTTSHARCNSFNIAGWVVVSTAMIVTALWRRVAYLISARAAVRTIIQVNKIAIGEVFTAAIAIKAIVVPFLIESLNTRAGDRLLALGTVVVRRVRVCFGLRDVVLALIANWFAGIVCVVLITGSNATRAFFTVQCRIVVLRQILIRAV
jgi:hypothetical protein